MTEENKETPIPDYVKHRKCPGCQTPIQRLQLSTFSTPVEDWAIPWLLMINESLNYSTKTLGQSTIHEPQFMAFTSNCHVCSLISWWDMGKEELLWTIKNPGRPNYIWRLWTPENVKLMLEKIPEAHRKPFEELLKVISKGDTK